jgi:hypothetical protein
VPEMHGRSPASRLVPTPYSSRRLFSLSPISLYLTSPTKVVPLPPHLRPGGDRTSWTRRSCLLLRRLVSRERHDGWQTGARPPCHREVIVLLCTNVVKGGPSLSRSSGRLRRRKQAAAPRTCSSFLDHLVLTPRFSVSLALGLRCCYRWRPILLP